MKAIRIIVSSAVIALCADALAGAPPDANSVQIDRYSLQRPTPSAEQTDLLQTTLDVRFPQSVTTTGAAIDYLLQRSGYQRVDRAESRTAMGLPLPRVHRKIGPLDLRTALETIAGTSWELHEDVQRRVVWFQLAGADRTGMPDPAPAPIAATAGPERSSTIVSAVHGAADQTRNWNLDPARTLRGNLDDWTKAVGWNLEWSSRHDYEIAHAAKYSGTFADAVQEALRYYRGAPAPLTASFYRGNSVLVITPQR